MSLSLSLTSAVLWPRFSRWPQAWAALCADEALALAGLSPKSGDCHYLLLVFSFFFFVSMLQHTNSYAHSIHPSQRYTMPPSKQTKKAPPRNGNAKTKASPYNKNAKNDKAATSTAAKKTQLNVSRPGQARNKHLNVNLTSELDSLLGDLNSQLHRKKTKRDVRSNIVSGRVW